jgi:hypothetical protein
MGCTKPAAGAIACKSQQDSLPARGLRGREARGACQVSCMVIPRRMHLNSEAQGTCWSLQDAHIRMVECGRSVRRGEQALASQPEAQAEPDAATSPRTVQGQGLLPDHALMQG